MPTADKPPQLADLAKSWERSLRAKNRSPTTITGYLTSLRLFDEFTATPVSQIRRAHVEAFIGHLLSTRKPTTASTRYRALAQFFKWLVIEGEIEADPMAQMTEPTVPEIPVDVLTDQQLRALLAVCEGKDLLSRRDLAIFRLFIDTPCRLSEIANLLCADVDFDAQTIRVIQKGSKEATKPFGPKCLVALDRYMRVRGAHRYAINNRLWLAPTGPLTSSGLRQMLLRRARQAGLPPIHAHQFRHTFSHRWKVKGGRDEDLMDLAGWSTPAMLRRYGASVAAERTKEAYRKMGLTDEI